MSISDGGNEQLKEAQDAFVEEETGRKSLASAFIGIFDVILTGLRMNGASHGAEFFCSRGAKTIEEARTMRLHTDEKCKKCAKCCGGTSHDNCDNPSNCTQKCGTFP